MRSLESITDSVDRNLGAFWETVRDGEAWSAAVHTVAESTERQLSNYFFKKGDLERKVLIPSKGIFNYVSCCYEWK